MRVVVALGGNALGDTPAQQLQLVKTTAVSLVDLVQAGHQLVIAHGNGPQVGMINQAMETAHQAIATPEIPFPECGAMSQGYIGYHLQNALNSELASRGIDKDVVTLITQVIVDENDPGFEDPSKPIGSFYDQKQAEEYRMEKGWISKEDAGRGYRRVIASPQPLDIVEKNVIKTLVDRGTLVIAVGGGGIPVIRKQQALLGVAAVIDKDFAAGKLAEIMDADVLLILTAVARVMINFNTPQAEELAEMDSATAKQYCLDGQFAAGSMLPKVQAALKFAESGTDRIAIIAELAQAKEALAGKSGTRITRNGEVKWQED